MTDWQVTATTIYCDAVDDEVTVMVYRDFSTRCTGYHRYGTPSKESSALLRDKSRKSGRELKCEGPECQRVAQYRDKLVEEEAERSTAETSDT